MVDAVTKREMVARIGFNAWYQPGAKGDAYDDFPEVHGMWLRVADAILATLSPATGRAEGGENEPSELRHYAERVGFAGDMGVVDRQFGFVRCVLPYDYRYTSNSQQHDEAEKICRALEGPMQALGVVSVVPDADPAGRIALSARQMGCLGSGSAPSTKGGLTE